MGNYQIVSGYWSGDGWRGQDGNERIDFFEKLWYPNTVKYGDTENIAIINNASTKLPNKLGQWIDLQYNCGHLGDLKSENKYTGWSITFILGAFLAYSNNCDLVFKEQDCLAFGDWIGIMYDWMKRKKFDMLVGHPDDSNGQALEQSLFIIKKDLILDFVNAYIAIDDSDWRMINEVKFRKVIDQKFRKRVGYLPFGYGRARPQDFKNETFYIQQVSNEDIHKLSSLSLL